MRMNDDEPQIAVWPLPLLVLLLGLAWIAAGCPT